MTLKVSKETKSKAYQFMKCLLKDGADGTQINELVTEMGNKLGQDVSGQILMDLLINPEDVHADVKHHSHWFGPVGANWYAAVADHWANFCDENDIRGHITFGNLDYWKKWAKTGNYEDISEKELKEMSEQCQNMIIVFKWWADDLVSRDALETIDYLYNATNKDKDK